MNKRNNVFVGFAISVVLVMLVASGMAMPIQEKVVSDSLVSEPVEDGGCSLCAEDLTLDTAVIVRDLEALKEDPSVTPEMSAQIDRAIAIISSPAPGLNCQSLRYFLFYTEVIFVLTHDVNIGYTPNHYMPDWWDELYYWYLENCGPYSA